MSNYALFVEGLDDAQDGIAALNPEILRAVRMSVNKGADRGRAEAARRIGRELNFPARYISGSNGKLNVTSRASDSKLEAVIAARRRATSLARFATDRSPAASRKRGGVNIAVKSGGAKFMPRAFLIRLKSGNRDLDTAHNLGLALRLRPGEQIDNKRIKAKRVEGNLYLLYGPSVDQAFINAGGRGVAYDITPHILDLMETEFSRLLKVKA